MRYFAKPMLLFVIFAMVAELVGDVRGQTTLPYPSLDQSYGLPTNPTQLPSSASPIVSRRAQANRSIVNSMGNMPNSTISTPPMTGHVRNAIGFFGGNSAAVTLQSMPRRPSFTAGAAVVGQNRNRPTKPFQTASQSPTVSPYLNLYREESEEAAPNYFALVRPALQQQAANRQNQLQLQRLNRQLQRVSTSSGSPPPTGFRSRFMNTGQYYNTLAR